MATDVFTSSGTWNCPAGVTTVTAECWGGGGGGAHGNSSSDDAGGGGGGGYSRKAVPVTPGNTYTVTVGIGGTGAGTGDANGNNGGDSWFIDALTVLAKGGQGGQFGGTGGQGGQAADGIGDVKYSGGRGGNVTGFGGGGGGGGAGDSSDGSNGGDINSSDGPASAGTGGTTGGGNGGVGGTAGSGTGGDASTIGGGGGGSRTAGGSYGRGGNGARGEVRLTYVPFSMDTDPVDDISWFTATANGEVVGAIVSERGFVYDTSSHGDPGNVAPGSSSYAFVENETGTFSPGTYDLPLTGLTFGTTYYVRAYALNSVGDYEYGGEVSFSTVDIDPPVVDTVSSSENSAVSFTLVGDVVDSDSQPITERGFVYGKTSESDPGNVAPGSSGYDSFISASGTFVEEEYSRVVSSLDQGSTYYFRAYALTVAGYAYGDELSFETGFLPPEITEVDPPGVVLNTEAEITIYGNNFGAGATVMFGDEEGTDVVVVDEHTITVTCPASAVQKVVTLRVINPDDGEGTAEFFYMTAIPNPPAEEPVRAKLVIEAVGYSS